MMVVNSSRKSSTHRWTTQNRQKSVVVKLASGAGEQPDGVEGRDRQRGEEEQPGHVAQVLAAQAPAQAAVEHHDPEEQADGRAGSARSGRGPGTRSPDCRTTPSGRRASRGCPRTRRPGCRRPRSRARRAARRRASFWPRGSRPAIIGREEDAAARNEVATQKIGELHMPGARQVVGKNPRQIDAEEARQSAR